MYLTEIKLRQTTLAILTTGSVTVTALLLGACASSGNRESGEISSTDTCGAGKTLVCEVPNTGRIKHGSFSKGSKTCACEVAGETGPPIIPGIP
ncbi:MAG TPA: hypothetical protein VGA68_11400, partial [Woeseiaceae bacterium]|jgi:hypothetical protein